MSVFPARLQFGDTIGIISPANPSDFENSNFKTAENYLKSKGFNLLYGSSVGRNTILSAEERANDFNELIKNPNVKCIMTTAGGGSTGKNSSELFEYIDWNAVKQNPKIFIGLSDITSLLLAVYAKTDIITFYGPNFCSTFGETIDEFQDDTFKYFSSICLDEFDDLTLTMPNKWSQISDTIPSETNATYSNFQKQLLSSKEKEQFDNCWYSYNEGKVTAKLIGGNLDTINECIKNESFVEYITPKDQNDEYILFIEENIINGCEDFGERQYKIKLKKFFSVFPNIVGLVFSKTNYVRDILNNQIISDPVNLFEGIENALRELNLNIPILLNFDSGHTHPMITLPIGAKATLNTYSKTLTIFRK